MGTGPYLSRPIVLLSMTRPDTLTCVIHRDSHITDHWGGFGGRHIPHLVGMPIKATSSISLPSPPAPVPSTLPGTRTPTGIASRTLHLASWVLSPLYGAVLLLVLVGFAVLGLSTAGISGASHPATAASVQTDEVAYIAPRPQLPVRPVGLMVRGQPMRWSQAESQAFRERAAGQPYDVNEYKAAMKAAQFNQKNGWSDDGTERLGNGAPLRNNQKRGGDSNNDPCLASFTLTAGICERWRRRRRNWGRRWTSGP
jgi:hypothetical protein